MAGNNEWSMAIAQLLNMYSFADEYLRSLSQSVFAGQQNDVFGEAMDTLFLQEPLTGNLSDGGLSDGSPSGGSPSGGIPSVGGLLAGGLQKIYTVFEQANASGLLDALRTQLAGEKELLLRLSGLAIGEELTLSGNTGNASADIGDFSGSAGLPADSEEKGGNDFLASSLSGFSSALSMESETNNTQGNGVKLSDMLFGSRGSSRESDLTLITAIQALDFLSTALAMEYLQAPFSDVNGHNQPGQKAAPAGGSFVSEKGNSAAIQPMVVPLIIPPAPAVAASDNIGVDIDFAGMDISGYEQDLHRIAKDLIKEQEWGNIISLIETYNSSYRY